MNENHPIVAGPALSTHPISPRLTWRLDLARRYKQYFVALRTAFPDIRFSVEDEIAEGGKVALRWSATGTHQGDYAGIRPTGKRGVITGTTVFHIADGKAVECWTNLDELGMLRQLGVLPAPG